MHPAFEPCRASIAGRAVCVTGGAGFIGSHLADALVGLGARVALLDDLSNGLRSNLSGPAGRAAFVQGSILDPAALDRAIAGADTVFHLAALGSVPRSIEEPALFQRVNVEGTLAVLEACRRHGVRRVVYAASSSAYGNTAALPKHESIRPDPRSPYAFTKLAGEHLMRSFALSYGLETVSLRYFNIFGLRQRHDSPYAAVIPMFAEALRAGARPVVYGDGRQTRDFTFVANAVHANLLAAASPARLAGEVANVACGTRYSLLELLDAMGSALGRRAEPEFRPARAGDVQDSEADIRHAEELLGYRVIVPFVEGLRLTLA
ncbi:MAG: NAD-dependent epimerase/dehydratase family protein [Planctomycetota bacterium]